MGPNEVDVKDLASLPNASEKDSAAPAIQKYAEPGKKQVSRAKFRNTLFHHWITVNCCYYLSCCQKCIKGLLCLCTCPHVCLCGICNNSQSSQSSSLPAHYILMM